MFRGLFLVVGIALWSVWPMVIQGDRVADYGKDGMYLATIQMNWHQKISDYIRYKLDPEMGFFDGYFFYAEKNSLAYSDMLLVTSLFTYFPAIVSKNPTIGAGLALVMGQVLTMVVSYAIFVKMSKSVWGGVVGSVAFGLSQIHYMYQVHLHTWNMSLWLIGYWLFAKKNYFLSAVFLGLQFWESPLGVYFGMALITIWIFTHNAPSDPPLNLRGGRNFLLFSLVFGMVAFLPAKTYWEVSNYYQYVRTIRDAAHHAISLNYANGFWSVGLFTLFVFSIFKLISYKVPKVKFKSIKFFGLLIFFSYILALGPVLKWSDKTVKIGGVMPIPLPYAVAYYAVPGWQAFRVPSRWLVVMGWGVAGIIAIGFGHLNICHFSFKKTIGLFGLFAIAILGGTRIVKYVDLPREIPKEFLTYQEVLIFKPMGDEVTEIERMYFAILAGKKTFNGFSGFTPPERVKYLNEY